MSALHDSLHERYGATAPTITASLARSEILEHLLAHRSVRAFTPDALPENTLELLVAAAQSAASSSNLQTWSVVAVRDAQRKSRLAEHANHQGHIKEAPLFLVWLADLSRLDRVAGRRGQQADANRFLEMFLVAAIDATLAAQNAVVAAEALGLGTVYIGAIRNKPEQVSSELKLPAHVFPLFGLCVGRPDPQRLASVKPRLPQSTVLHQEAYSDEGEASAVQRYDDLIQSFQHGQGLPPVPWSQQASQRVAGPGSLSGRHRLVEEIRAQGFELE